MFEVDKTPRKTDWFNYMKDYKTVCIASERNPAKFSYRKCYEEILTRQRISDLYLEPVDKCIADSWESEGHSKINKQTMDNRLLRESWSQYQYRLIYIIPSVLINNFMYRGDLDARDVAGSICDSFKTVPDNCKELGLIVVPNPVDYKKSEKEERFMEYVGYVLGFGLGLFACVTTGLIYYFESGASTEVGDMVRNEVGDYIRMRDTETIELPEVTKG